ncbi:Acetoacetate decarboxylase (ADC) [Amycolatopsis arida]|uniref:Acetoacetate decarboxylase (ADC) n=1 Tax=Amycolatopsis arida TaxID=587909 RepID=A0A1I5YZ35_9PSEU|nr:acetoacetate decarboxylase family protein [Amycolatopsis arida]TDX89993.1 acetoacetate decarboxylase [Amycolatopsis arida]SFQ49476.1 Acetoacetate decarboxylase (ADC) [Amycolatopsis arida]
MTATPPDRYPPEPWHLAGQAYLSTWLVPVADLPRVPRELRPVVVAGRAVVVTAWIDYQPPGQLSYAELLATVAVRDGHGPSGPSGPTATITEIWVDSAVSLAGGRELWGIPKELAAFDLRHGRTFTASATTSRDWIATAAFTSRPGPPVTLPSRFRVAQVMDGEPRSSRVRARARPHWAAASWSVNPAGPLGYLAGRAPLLSARLRDFRMRFGG